MQFARQKVRAFAVAGLALAMVLSTSRVASAGFFDNLFGSQRQESPAASPAALPYAATTAPAAQPRQPTISSVPSIGYGAVTYCVRLCDGRYFPMQRHAGATPVQLCSAFCPAASTQVFSGATIDHAVAPNGARYAALENAFVYRKTIVPGCTCNGRDAFGLAHVDVAKDPTLRAGDIVVTARGPVQVGAAAGEPRRIARAN